MCQSLGWVTGGDNGSQTDVPFIDFSGPEQPAWHLTGTERRPRRLFLYLMCAQRTVATMPGGTRKVWELWLLLPTHNRRIRMNIGGIKRNVSKERRACYWSGTTESLQTFASIDIWFCEWEILSHWKRVRPTEGIVTVQFKPINRGVTVTCRMCANCPENNREDQTGWQISYKKSAPLFAFIILIRNLN